MHRSRTLILAAALAAVVLATDLSALAAAEPLHGQPPAPDQTSYAHTDIGNSALSPDEQVRIAQARLEDHPHGDALNHLGEDGKHPVITDARSPRLQDNAQVNAYTPVTWEECRAHTYDNKDHAYWYRDKFNFCRIQTLGVNYHEIRDGTIVEVGNTAVTLGIKATAVDGQNTVNFDVVLTDFKDEGTTYKEWPLSFQLPCVNADPARTSTCTEPGGSVVYRKPIGQWEAEAGTEYRFTKTMATTAVPAGTYQAEMRGFFSANVYMVLESPILGPETSSTLSVLMRCDSATYAGGSKCVAPDATSVMRFSATDPTLSESAQFIRDAQTDITLTKPGVAGKRVPGVLGSGTALHRLYSAYDFKKDIKASRRRVPKTCRLYYGPKYTVGPNGQARQCDEYPFATTYENSARVNNSTVFDYAVRAISKEHNETAGRLYGAWLGYDHILDGDPFYVEIVP